MSAEKMYRGKIHMEGNEFPHLGAWHEPFEGSTEYARLDSVEPRIKELEAMVKILLPVYCGAMCPSVWKTSEGMTHCDECDRMTIMAMTESELDAYLKESGIDFEAFDRRLNKDIARAMRQALKGEQK